jgi:hypothetical protein
MDSNLDILNKEGKCPDCGNGVFLHGPCGGMAENIRCSECGAEFNFAPPFSPERIDRNEPALYHGAFRVSDELEQNIFVEPKPWPLSLAWWKKILVG